MSTALPALDNVAAPVTVTFPPPAPERKAMPEPPETPSVPKVRVPEELFWNEMPSVPPVTEVLPKAMAAVVVPIRMPVVVLPETVVEPNETVPVRPVRLIPWLVLELVATLVKAEVAAKAPVVRSSALPVPLKVTSAVVLLPTVRVPKLLPKILAPVVLPTVSPRTVLPLLRLTPLVAATEVVMIGFVSAPLLALVAGRAARVPWAGALMPKSISKPAVTLCRARRLRAVNRHRGSPA